mmetsp:Transcript_14927/g.52397  ORF Transcript_14927/g.52397 Transcript_14927/m.52397 type:complete len:205 (+) Transcript_14927:1302-1916(+)
MHGECLGDADGGPVHGHAGRDLLIPGARQRAPDGRRGEQHALVRGRGLPRAERPPVGFRHGGVQREVGPLDRQADVTQRLPARPRQVFVEPRHPGGVALPAGRRGQHRDLHLAHGRRRGGLRERDSRAREHGATALGDLLEIPARGPRQGRVRDHSVSELPAGGRADSGRRLRKLRIPGHRLALPDVRAAVQPWATGSDCGILR